MRKTFENFTVSEMFCPRCRQATPVRDRLLLVLPGSGEKHDLICAICGELVGERMIDEDDEPPGGVVIR